MLCGDEFGDEGEEMNSVGRLFGLRDALWAGRSVGRSAGLLEGSVIISH